MSQSAQKTYAITGCPGCGLYLGHVPGCYGCIAVFMQYGREFREEEFQTPEAAERWLADGEDYGNLSSVAVLLPDGTVWKSREALGVDWPRLTQSAGKE
jgi:hypothetical protein